MPARTAIAVRHVSFEDLGSFAPRIESAGYRIEYRDVGVDEQHSFDPLAADLLIVLGGPIGAYEEEQYPFLQGELRVLQDRLAAGAPTLGICLGAQLMARALGARVYPGPRKEIGWSPLELTAEGRHSVLRHLGDAAVLHWHGDTFDLPQGCARLASTAICRNQAFMKGPNILGLQFHAEAVDAGFERWLVGHACELAQAAIRPRDLRAQADAHVARLKTRSQRMIDEWLAGLKR